jgi:uncharacterized cysteine cluster protein YcgN (CxxCxxCC family)
MTVEYAFWKSKPLHEMTNEEWESLCDGCARCCLHKLEDEDSGELYYTNIACRLLDIESCRCKDYQHRMSLINDCISLNPDNIKNINWLPSTCAYRLLAEGQDLPKWHPLLTGTYKSVKEAGISVKNMAVPETPDIKLEEHIIGWTATPDDQENTI